MLHHASWLRSAAASAAAAGGVGSCCAAAVTLRAQHLGPSHPQHTQRSTPRGDTPRRSTCRRQHVLGHAEHVAPDLSSGLQPAAGSPLRSLPAPASLVRRLELLLLLLLPLLLLLLEGGLGRGRARREAASAYKERA